MLQISGPKYEVDLLKKNPIV